jgi:hypothetical protein
VEIDLYGLWWDAADAGELFGSPISQFVSREGLSHFALQATASSMPKRYSTGIVFDGDDNLSRTAATNLASYVRCNTVPDSTFGMSPSSTGKGFTCTGLTRVPGTDDFWIGNHGDQSAGHDGTGPWSPSLVKVRRNTTTGALTKLDEIGLASRIPGIQSVQDVTYDTSDDTLWFASATAAALLKVYHITTAGVLVGDDITPTWAPNGLAYDPRDDGIWINRESSTGNGLEKRSCSTGLVTMAAINPGLNNADQLFFDTTTTELLLSYGANTPPGNVQVYNAGGLTSLVASGTIALPFPCNATEGIDRSGTVLLNLNDDWYHPAGNLLNQLVECKCVPPTPKFITISLTASVSATTGTDCFFEIGTPLGGNGFGVYPTSTTGINCIANTGASGVGQQGTVTGTSLSSLTTLRLIDITLDVPNQLGTLYIDGVSKATGSLAALVGGITTAQALRIGTASDVRPITGTIKDIIMVTGAANRQKLEGYRAWRHDLVANLDVSHPYKGSPP